MSDLLNDEKRIILDICNDKDSDMICKISHALSVPERVQIMKAILKQSKSVKEISDETGIPFTSVTRHVDILADAQLIMISYRPGKKGHIKYCAQTIVGLELSFESDNPDESENEQFSIEMPVGLFSDCKIEAPCGMISKTGRLCTYDDPTVFFSPERVNAECIWFEKGFLSYNFPNKLKTKNLPNEISFSFEVCSETAYYNENWPSDISIFINDIEIAMFTSPGDFGGRRGKFTPEFWGITSTQFGLLKNLTVDKRGVSLDNVLISKSITVDDLNLVSGKTIKFTIGVKPDAQHVGGINLFGKNFGDYPQSIVMTIK